MTNEAADGCARGMQEWMTNKYCSLCSLREHTVSFQTYSTGKYFKVLLCYKFVPFVTFYAVMLLYFHYSSYKASSSWENKIGEVCSKMYRKKTAPFWVRSRIIGQFNWLWPKMATLAAPHWSSGISSICTQATVCDMYHTGIVAVWWEQLLQQSIHNWFILNFKWSKILAMTIVS